MLPNTSKPQQNMPEGACDCHVHVFEPARFPFSAARSYTPAAATVEDLQGMHTRLGVHRTVLVQPSCYGTDNRALLDAIARIGQHQARGIAVLDLDTSTGAQRQALHAQGVRGLRLNFATRSSRPEGDLLEEIVKADEAACALGWSVHLHAPAALVAALGRELAQLRAPLVFDHFAGFDGSTWSAGDAAWRVLLSVLEGGRAYVKLSAPYRAAPALADLKGMTQALVRTAPTRLLWGSDWPHTGGSGVRTASAAQIEPFREVDAGAWLDLLCEWVPEPALRRLIFVDNPSRLFGFAGQS